MNKKKLFIWETIGVFAIIALGVVIHFAFDWLSQFKPLAGLLAVNESIWEHAKLTFIAPLIFAIIEFFIIRKDGNNFVVAKVASFFAATLAMIMLFYTCAGILGRHCIVLDLTIFVVSIIIAQMVSYKLLTMDKLHMGYYITSMVALVIMIGVFYLFTFYPPALPLFYDYNSELYGIIPK